MTWPSSRGEPCATTSSREVVAAPQIKSDGLRADRPQSADRRLPRRRRGQNRLHRRRRASHRRLSRPQRSSRLRGAHAQRRPAGGLYGPLRLDLAVVRVAERGAASTSCANAPIGSQGGSTIGSRSSAACSSAGRYSLRAAISNMYSSNHESFIVKKPFWPAPRPTSSRPASGAARRRPRPRR